MHKGCDAELARQLVGALAAEGLLSDARFAEALVQARRARGYGPVRIRRELQEKGLADDLIDRELAVDEQEWIELLRAVRRKKFGQRMPGDYAERARQARFLLSRGFTYDQIRAVLNPDETD